MRKSKSLLQVFAAIDVVHEAILKFRGADLDCLERNAIGLASLIRAYDAMENRKRILLGRPLPGTFRPESKSKRKLLDITPHTITDVLTLADQATQAAQAIDVPAKVQPSSPPVDPPEPSA